LLHVHELLRRAHLACGHEVLHARDDHWDDRKGLGEAPDFSDHATFHDLRFDLAKPGKQASLGVLGNQQSCWPHQRIDDIARSQNELLDPPRHSCMHNGLGEIDLGLIERGLSACLFRRKLCGKFRLSRRLARS